MSCQSNTPSISSFLLQDLCITQLHLLTLNLNQSINPYSFRSPSALLPLSQSSSSSSSEHPPYNPTHPTASYPPPCLLVFTLFNTTK